MIDLRCRCNGQQGTKPCECDATEEDGLCPCCRHRDGGTCWGRSDAELDAGRGYLVCPSYQARHSDEKQAVTSGNGELHPKGGPES